ncbi:MAG: peptide-methionine (S)-S-oxide reductase MsrA [Rhizomicrobium sp.]
MAIASFAGGCFWGVEALFRAVPGVTDAVCGYEGGHSENPTYKEVCTDATGHAETVQLTFDPAVISFDGLLDAFFGGHNPTTLNEQGVDKGTQYRSVIFYHDAEQEAIARGKVAALTAAKIFTKPIVTEIVPAVKFWPAEEYHQRYFEKHPDEQVCHFGEH